MKSPLMAEKLIDTVLKTNGKPQPVTPPEEAKLFLLRYLHHKKTSRKPGRGYCRM